jgi:hypothetical protein
MIHSNGNIFVGTSGGGVFRSNTDGDTWVQTGLTNRTVHSLSKNSIGEVFAGTDQGVYWSDDNGTTWQEASSGLKHAEIKSLVIGSDGIALAGTRGGGVYRSIRSTTSMVDHDKNVPSSPEMLQNYPNPFNPTTTFRFSLSRGAHVDLSIYDINGQIVRTLVSDFLLSGNHSVVWDGYSHNRELAACGIYLSRLIVNGATIYRKITLIK